MFRPDTVLTILDLVRRCLRRDWEVRRQVELSIADLRHEMADMRIAGYGYLSLLLVANARAAVCLSPIAADAVRRLWRRTTGAPCPVDTISTRERLVDDWRHGRRSRPRDVRLVERGLGGLAREERLLSLAILANLLYLSGHMERGRELARQGLSEAKLTSIADPCLLILLSYPAANSALFLGKMSEAKRLLTIAWNLARDPRERERLRRELVDLSTVHGLGSIPRHLVILWLLTDSDYSALPSMTGAIEPGGTIRWITECHQEGLTLCAGDRISTDFTNCYVALALSVFLSGCCKPAQRRAVAERINSLLVAVPEAAPLPSQYARAGVRGVFEFVEGRFDAATNFFAEATAAGDGSDNRFLGFLFTAIEAVAHGQARRWDAAKRSLSRFDRYPSVEFHEAIREQALRTVETLKTGRTWTRVPTVSTRIQDLLRPR